VLLKWARLISVTVVTKVAAGCVIAALISTPALAADMALKAPPAPTAYKWSSCYAGANAGWIGSINHYGDGPSGSYLTPPGALAPPNILGSGDFASDIAVLTHSYSVDGSGGLIGGQIGCNKQIGAFVLGGEADLQWSSLTSSASANYPAFANVGNPLFTDPAHTENLSSKLEAFSTFRGRVGYAWDRLFIYGTGGLAVADLQSQTNATFGTVPVLGVYSGATHVASTSLTRPGWVGGGGAEYAFAANWSLKGEYLYMDFGTYSYSSPLIAETAPFGPGYSWGSSVREQLVRIGLNYKFNWSPLLGKYQARAIPLAASAEE
jgi:outer membrane immunogenic protein